MPSSNPGKNSLVLYKQEPALVRDIESKRITIELANGELLRVRPKDVLLIHPGPLSQFITLDSNPLENSELIVAWEILAGEETTLRELAELAFGEFTPAAAWSAWQMVADGLYLRGEPDHIVVCTADEVRSEQEKRTAREAEQARWNDFLHNVATGCLAAADEPYLRDVEALALGQLNSSKVLQALGREQTPENAHDLLLALGYWQPEVNPYPTRAGMPTVSVHGDVPAIADEPRRDLTHLPALAIDDEGNEDPDDAISWENGRIWIHVADVAAMVKADDPLDLAARHRGANLYLPEKTVLMLPSKVTDQLGLGLRDPSPALSFGIDLAEDGQIGHVEIVPSWIRVTRLTYEEAEAKLGEPPLLNLLPIAERYRTRRQIAGAVELSLPEVRVKVQDGRVSIKPLPNLQSRDLVREAMLMTGEAVAVFAQSHDIPIPYTVQEPPTADLPLADTMSAMFATRKLLRPSRQSRTPGKHSGLGMVQYAQVTSPLRRYLDLVIHQQLRAYLGDQPLLTTQEIVARIGATEAVQRDLRRAERLSRQHWTLVFMLQNPTWQGEGVILEKHGRRYTILLPTVELESDLYLPGEFDLDSRLTLELEEVKLPYLLTKFRLVKSPQSP